MSVDCLLRQNVCIAPEYYSYYQKEIRRVCPCSLCERLRAEPVRAMGLEEELMDWQPIETAPKDGRWVLVCGGNWRVIMAWYALNPRIDRAYWKVSDEWDDYELADDQPTHWMPLPEPPVNVSHETTREEQ